MIFQIFHSASLCLRCIHKLDDTQCLASEALSSAEMRKHMKLMKEFGIILAVTFIGEVIKYIIPLQIPASIYGLVLMLIALKIKIIPLESVREAGKFMIEIMPMMFIPAAVGLLNSWGTLKSICIPVIIITVVSTILVMAVAGRVTQLIIRLEKRKPDEGNAM